MGDFHDHLTSLCIPEINAAMRTNDTDRAADMITALATMLGRTIARATDGKAVAINTMLIGTEELIAAEAAGMAGIMALANTAKRARI